MTRWILAAAALAALVLGGLWWTRRELPRDPAPAAPAAPAADDRSGAGRDASGPSLPPARASNAVSQAQEQREVAFTAEVAGELALDAAQAAEVQASLAQMQAGRRELFAGRAAGRVTTEEVSQGLRQLRSAMNARIEVAIGAEKAARLRERMRAEHGFEPAPSPL